MYAPPVRTVEVTKQFYAQLAEYMQSEERWLQEVDASRYGIVLYVVGPDGDSRKLVFTARREDGAQSSIPDFNAVV